eukprot:gene3889-biopygen5591
MLQVLEKEQVQRLSLGKELPQFRAGDVLEVTTVGNEGAKGLNNSNYNAATVSAVLPDQQQQHHCLSPASATACTICTAAAAAAGMLRQQNQQNQQLQWAQPEADAMGCRLPSLPLLPNAEQVVPEADRKVYTYKGVCIARANKGPRSWFKVYNVFPDVGGFVQHLPLYMPDIVAVKVVGRLPKAKRSKLYHLLQDESPRHVYQSSIAPPK